MFNKHWPTQWEITNNYEDESFAIAEAKGGKGATKYTYSLDYEGTLVTTN